MPKEFVIAGNLFYVKISFVTSVLQDKREEFKLSLSACHKTLKLSNILMLRFDVCTKIATGLFARTPCLSCPQDHG